MIRHGLVFGVWPTRFWNQHPLAGERVSVQVGGAYYQQTGLDSARCRVFGVEGRLLFLPEDEQLAGTQLVSKPKHKALEDQPRHPCQSQRWNSLKPVLVQKRSDRKQ